MLHWYVGDSVVADVIADTVADGTVVSCSNWSSYLQYKDVLLLLLLMLYCCI